MRTRMESGGSWPRAPWWLALALAICATTAIAAPRKAGDIVVETRTTKLPNGDTLDYELGTLFVPENRSTPGSRLIGVGFARIRAAKPAGVPPIFVLPGGPGRTYLNALTDGDASQLQNAAAYAFPYLAAGDVVIVDQRGYSQYGDVLELAARAQPLDRPRSRSADAADMIRLAGDAVAAHPGKDLAGYTIVQCAEDVNDLRHALGYDRITLSGQSFGSQWSFAVMRLHPEIVARALLSGVEPLDKSFDMPSQVFASLQRIAWDADRDPALKPYLPQGGLMAALREVRDRFANGEPIRVDIKADATGQTRGVTLGLEDFQGSLLRSADSWPSFVLSLYYRHYEDWARETVERRNNIEGPVRLIEPLIDSSLGVSAGRGHLLRTDPGAEYLGFGDFDAVVASADAWPTPDVGDSLRLPVASAIPVVFFNGDWDTSTPVDNMFGALPYFPNSRAIVVHRGGHHTRARAFAQQPELLAEVIDFLKTGDLDGLPVEVSLPAPAFQRPAFPPP
ncbi:MAG TPA: alpha/beta fold hydrolase [Luteimonas sp.]|nr:alpha/beta fold hydrolase [Luteimonas sp.]